MSSHAALDSTHATILGTRGEAWTREAVVSPETTRQAQMGKIFGYTKGLHAVHLIAIGARLGLFERLAASATGLTPGTLAAVTGLHPPYVQVWCESACALELLDYDPATGYRLAPFMDEILGQPQATYYLGGAPEAHLQLARDYARYPDFFQTGGVHTYQQHDAPFFEGVAGATQALPRMFLDAVLPRLPKLAAQLNAGATVLDVGCGGGRAIVEFAERYPQARCIGIDVEPTSVGMAQELIRARGLGDRVEARVVEGAEWPSDLAGSFDLVMSFLVLHEIHPDLKDAIIGQSVRALRPDGSLLIFDERYPSAPSELRDPAQVFAVMAQWYELTWGNIVNTREEIEALVARQGFRVIDETALSRFHIVVASREA